jgi:choline-sulfatase
MYEEAAFIPMIVAGPNVPENKVSNTPVTLLDIAPTVLDAAGLDEQATEQAFPGRSLVEIAKAEPDPDRVAFCEYYAAAADRAAFMIRKGQYKYIHYVGYEPELFNLEADPEELSDLSHDAHYRTAVADYEAILRTIVDPVAADEAAYRSQTALVDANGGREALMARGKYEHTPAPGEAVAFSR